MPSALGDATRNAERNAITTALLVIEADPIVCRSGCDNVRVAGASTGVLLGKALTGRATFNSRRGSSDRALSRPQRLPAWPSAEPIRHLCATTFLAVTGPRSTLRITDSQSLRSSFRCAGFQDRFCREERGPEPAHSGCALRHRPRRSRWCKRARHHC